jgi:hypothetical protein
MQRASKSSLLDGSVVQKLPVQRKRWKEKFLYRLYVRILTMVRLRLIRPLGSLASKSGFTEAIFSPPSAVKLVSLRLKLLPSKLSIVVTVAHVVTAKEGHVRQVPHVVAVVKLDNVHQVPHALVDHEVVKLDNVHQVPHAVVDHEVVKLDNVRHANQVHHRLIDHEVVKLDNVHHANQVHHRLIDHEVVKLDNVHHANQVHHRLIDHEVVKLDNVHHASSLSIRDPRAAKILPLLWK